MSCQGLIELDQESICNVSEGTLLPMHMPKMSILKGKWIAFGAFACQFNVVCQFS